jgi:hypothetical protein
MIDAQHGYSALPLREAGYSFLEQGSVLLALNVVQSFGFDMTEWSSAASVGWFESQLAATPGAIQLVEGQIMSDTQQPGLK